MKNQKMKCCICGHEITGYGNNPMPVVTTPGAVCCDTCNAMNVVPTRMSVVEKLDLLLDIKAVINRASSIQYGAGYYVHVVNRDSLYEGRAEFTDDDKIKVIEHSDNGLLETIMSTGEFVMAYQFELFPAWL